MLNKYPIVHVNIVKRNCCLIFKLFLKTISSVYQINMQPLEHIPTKTHVAILSYTVNS